jgi:hypothetical protein
MNGHVPSGALLFMYTGVGIAIYLPVMVTERVLQQLTL